MYIFHRLNSNERKHYLLEEHHSFVVKPKLLYVGELKKLKDWKEEQHSHSFVEIIFIANGIGTLLIDEASYNIKKGDILIYNANVKHHEISSTDSPLEIFFIAYDDVKLTDLEQNQLIPKNYSLMYECNEMYDIFKMYFEVLINEISKKEKFFSEIAQSTSRTLLMYIFRLINNTVDTMSLLSKNTSFSKAIQYIEANYKEDFSLEDISNMFYINKYYLAHLFKAKKQTSIKNYILKKRLDEATDLLKLTKRTISSISEMLGFNNLNYFCRIFKQTHNMTPLEYRNSTK